MKTKHTSGGPWIAKDEHQPSYESYQIHNGKEIIAHGVNAKYSKLIVAAPDMLDILVELKELITEGFSEECTMSNEILSKVRKVINKATE